VRPRVDGSHALEPGRYHRATIDLRAKRFTDELVLDRSCECPTVARVSLS
jgi:carotenoid cleavage dioxygenase-like enzyme